MTHTNEYFRKLLTRMSNFTKLLASMLFFVRKLTSALNVGRYCLCNSIIIFKQTRTFSSLSIASNFNVNERIGLTYGRSKSFVGSLWRISKISFLTYEGNVKNIWWHFTNTLGYLLNVVFGDEMRFAFLKNFQERLHWMIQEIRIQRRR